MSNRMYDKIIIPIGENSDWCRTLPIKNDMPVGGTSKKLTIKGIRGTLSEYLLILLMNGYILRMDQDGNTNMITALHPDYVVEEADKIMAEQS